MKKIAIITYSNSKNFGAVLQTVALFYALTMISKESIYILDYYNEKIENNYYRLFNKSSLSKIIKSLIRIIIIPLYLKHRYNVGKLFRCFLEKNTRVTQKKYCKKNIKEADLEFDYFIVGSDQIWNFEVSGFDRTYYLDFVTNSNKKYSYAASFGFSDVIKSNHNLISELICDFKTVSVREDICIDELRKINKNILVSIDPALLLQAEDWEKLLFPNNETKKYILLFFTDKESTNLIDFARNLSRKTGLKLISIITPPSLKNFRGIKCIHSCSPEMFLSYFKNAEYVITSSFHGTVFSIIFHKRFFTEFHNKYVHNYRVESLLKKLKLEERAIKNCNLMNDYDKFINWLEADEILEKERQKSFDYLKKITDI